MSGGGNNVVNKVFYATSYHPIQAGSIDGTDIAPHDNGVRRALLCYNAGLYDPCGDSKAVGDPYCTLFVGHLSHLTTEDSLREALSKYGRIKSLRLVRHIVTGASRRYAFVEYESEKEMHRAYEDAHHSFVDDGEIIVDYNRQHLMPGWIPRRLGGGLGGRKESGQLRFGGRERPFRAPLRPIPHEDLKKLGIQLPPEGRYMSRMQIPSPPRRKGSVSDREEQYHREKNYVEREEELQEQRNPVKNSHKMSSHRESAHRRLNKGREDRSRIESRFDRKERSRRKEDQYGDKEEVSGSNKRSNHGEERPHKHHKHKHSSYHHSSRDHNFSD